MLLRRRMKVHENEFDGHFEKNCQQKAVPASLLIFAQMLLEGRKVVSDNVTGGFSQAVLSVSQTAFYNFKR